ncbi:transcriptional regulator [Pseudonocardia sulfidoxydans NBRC 16205]|uniref:Transcriptional regulator n=1 Tax=Pseudonocardia sulfidoxydans NBRC 16205 TaxID=1223511 RepID=A0A511DGK6_9PSEU|nr:YafY family protein [Pseudonocardia sulfidoxydans]GEL23912.1 transcriptional regulator [Pseudonocardia sulfidoxydans NBRC 16205]
MDPTARILRLLSLLQTYRHWSGDELSGRLEVSPRTLRRDVERLRELGYPVETSRGTYGGYQLAAGTQIPPLLLDDEEAVAIAVGLRTAANGAVAGIEETSVRALAKLQQVLPNRLRRRVEALTVATETVSGYAETVDPDTLLTIAQACRGSEQLRFHYTANDGSETSRLVEPHRLVSRYRRWYFVAWDIDRGDWRTFRADRVTRPFANGVRVPPRELPAEDAASFVNAALRSRPQPFTALLRVRGSVDELRERIPRWMGELTPDTDGTCLLAAGADNLEWLALSLVRLGAEAELVEGSDELVAELTRLRTGAEQLVRH